MLPSEFWNCTYRELYQYVNSNSLQREKEYKKQIVLFDALGDKIIDVIGRKHPKNISLVRNTFESLFEEELKPHQQTIEEQIQNLRSRK